MRGPPDAVGASVSLTGKEFERLQSLLTGFCGLSLSEEHRARLTRAVEGGMRRCALSEVEPYLCVLEADAGPEGERWRLVDEIANHETYFYREEQQLETLAGAVLPEVCKRGRRRLNLWSAGCASGEEPLTLGMLLMDSPLCAGALGGQAVRILGTDISRRMIRRAREARYAASSFKGLAAARRRDLQRRFFEREGDLFVPRPELRRLVSYLQLNLLDRDGTALFGDMDVILCRNVLMYFPAALRLQAIQGFYRKLAPRGFLLLGHSENLLGLDTPFEAQRLLGSLVYRKPARQPTPVGEEWGG